ncbi:hypothetical protein [Isoptericola variabilis]|uniref:hypothetical protein n=1 Tax=Isoptericola variabilis TaxID=139208 RepID=UPI00117F3050|nr:hypothetical protein [Isoptericola variabilis]
MRRRLSPQERSADPEHRRWTDVIAVVLAADDGGLRLRTDAPRSEPREVVVAADDVVAAKRIPPRRERPAGRADAREG